MKQPLVLICWHIELLTDGSAGTGGKPNLGEQAAQESSAELQAAVTSADMVRTGSTANPSMIMLGCLRHCRLQASQSLQSWLRGGNTS